MIFGVIAPWDDADCALSIPPSGCDSNPESGIKGFSELIARNRFGPEVCPNPMTLDACHNSYDEAFIVKSTVLDSLAATLTF